MFKALMKKWEILTKNAKVFDNYDNLLKELSIITGPLLYKLQTIMHQ